MALAHEDWWMRERVMDALSSSAASADRPHRAVARRSPRRHPSIAVTVLGR